MFIAAALVAVIVISSNSGDAVQDAGLAPNWSRWKPAELDRGAAPKEIAEHVGAEYKHPNGKQLVDVSGGELPPDVKLTSGRPPAPIATIDGTRVIYQLDGLGPAARSRAGRPPRRA